MKDTSGGNLFKNRNITCIKKKKSETESVHTQIETEERRQPGGDEAL